MTNAKTREIIDSLYEGDHDIRETVNTLFSEKAVEVLETKKQEVAKRFFAQNEE